MPETQEAKPSQTQQDDILAQFDLGDSSFDPELDGAHAPSVPKEPATKGQAATGDTPPPSPPRDDKGRFVKPEKPSHSPYFLRKAQELGVSDDEINELTPDELRDLVFELRLQTQQRQPGQAPEQDTTQRQPQVEDEVKLPINEADYDEGIVKVLKSIMRKQADIEKTVGSLAQAHHAKTQDDALDQVFASMKDYQAVIGEGRRKDLKPDSGEYARRRAIIQQAVALAGPKATFQQQLQHVPAAAKMLFGGLIQPKAPEQPVPLPEDVELAKKREAWNNGALSRPTHREAKEPKGVNRAARAVAGKMREMGMEVDGFSGNEELSLPD